MPNSPRNSIDPLGIDLQPRLNEMDDAQLSSANARAELAKLTFEYKEQKSWLWKILFSSILAPFASVILLLLGWYGSHATERHHQMEDVYLRSAKALSSNDPAVQLSSVKALELFMNGGETTWAARLSERLFVSKTSRELSEERSREAIALLMGRLSNESDPAVLDAIADAARHNAEQAAGPLLSTNKTGAVLFARAAGEFAGLDILFRHHAVSLSDHDPLEPEDEVTEEDKRSALSDIDVIVLRTGSPFQASARFNQRFSPADILRNVHSCGFHEIYGNQRTLAEGSGLNIDLRRKPPTIEQLNEAKKRLIDAAANLERSSYILGVLLDQNNSVFDNRKDGKTWDFDLFGTAVVLGELRQTAIDDLRRRGGYFNSPKYYDSNPGCQM
jgi:hypothetical protein